MRTQGQTILITGVSGYLATHVVDHFLRAGYSVRGTVRSAETAQKVHRNFPQYAETKQLTFAIVPDVSVEGAFNEAIEGVHGVIHTATPFQTDVQDVQRDLLDPAINGTLNIMRAVHAYAPAVSRVVLTSSFYAMIDMSKGKWPGHTYSEADWNPATVEDAIAPGAGGDLAYAVAKTVAERAAWEYTDEKTPHFDIAVILPSMLYGPNLNAAADINKLNGSLADFYHLMLPGNKSTDLVPENDHYSFVDVRDVAEAHLRAFENPHAGGQRFFVSKGYCTYQKFVDILRDAMPEIKDRVPANALGRTFDPASVYGSDVQRSERVLGLEYRDLRETIVDMARSLLELEKKSKTTLSNTESWSPFQ